MSREHERQKLLITRRKALASPLWLLLGKALGWRPASAQAPASAAVPAPSSEEATELAQAPGQADIDEFDFSFLPPADLTFALVADTHSDKRPRSFPLTPECFDLALRAVSGRNDVNDPRTGKVYAQLNASQPSFMIHLGDMIHGHPRDNRWLVQIRKALALLKKLEVPAHLVPGNHDIGNKLSMPIPGVKWPKAVGDPKDIYYISEKNITAYERIFGKAYFHFESAGSLFLVVNASVFNSGFESEAKQWRWLEETLATSGDYQNVFLAMHSLPYWSDVDEPGERNYEVVDEPGRSRLLALCAQYDVRAMFCGHVHHDYVRYHGSMLIAASPATSFSRDNWGLYYPLAPPTWDPARSAYSYARVYGRRVVRQVVRAVDHLPPPVACQANPTAPIRRLMARQTGDGVAGPIAVTVPVIRSHAGLSAPQNAVSRRGSGAGRADELRVAWVSGHAGQRESRLEVRFAQALAIARVVVESGMRTPFSYQIQVLPTEGSWQTIAQGRTPPPKGDRPPTPVEHSIEATASAVRLWVPKSKGQISVRGFRIYNSDAVDLAAIPNLAQISASSSEREVKMVHTAAFSQGFDLNPSYVRLDPRATAFSTISPVPGVLGVDPWLIETARHAKREGARLWGVLTADREGDFQAYARKLAEDLPEVEVWEVHGERPQVLEIMSAIGEASKDARFAVDPELDVPDADFAVTSMDRRRTQARQGVLSIHSPFPSRRHPELAIRLARALVSGLDSEQQIPCVSLLSGEGLLDGWDDPMPAFYVVRALNTVLAGARPSRRRHGQAPGLETMHLESSAGRFIVAWPRAGKAHQAPRTVRLRKSAAEAWWIDPVTSTSQQLAIDGHELRDLKFPDYPVILRLA